MKIHELNNFSGTLGAGSFLAVDDGNDTGKVSTQQVLAATEARIDNIIAGPAPSAEEIVDARRGADGVTYNSLGTAIRTQVTDLKSEINDNTSDISALQASVNNLGTHKVEQPLDGNNQPTNGTSGQSLRTKGDGTTEWADVGLPTDAQTAQAVSDWLDEHPEATTTVQDGSLTLVKFKDGELPFATPEEYGAKADGVTDDSLVFKQMITNGVQITLTNKTYYIAQPIMDGQIADLYIVGSGQRDTNWYTHDGSTLLVKDGVSLFKDSTISGTISGVAFVGEGASGQTSNTTQYFFDNCTVAALRFANNYVYNFEAFSYGSIVYETTIINNNRFLSVYNFAKIGRNSQKNYIGDTFITNNYINGGTKYTNNVFFGFESMAACSLIGNFVDYYQCMFSPLRGQMENNPYTLPTCSGNQWEMFRYLIDTRYVKAVYGSFSDEHFNHLGSTESPFKDYDAFTNSKGDIPPCLMNVVGITSDYLYQVTFDNLYFDQSCDGFNLLCQYADYGWFSSNPKSKIVLNVASIPTSWDYTNICKLPTASFNWYNDNNSASFLDSNIVMDLTELPIITDNVFSYIPEIRYQVGTRIYKLMPVAKNIYAFISETSAGQVLSLAYTGSADWNEINLKSLFGSAYGVYLVAVRTDYYTASSGVWIVEMSSVQAVVTALANVNALLQADASTTKLSYNPNYSSSQTYYMTITKLA